MKLVPVNYDVLMPFLLAELDDVSAALLGEATEVTLNGDTLEHWAQRLALLNSLIQQVNMG